MDVPSVDEDASLDDVDIDVSSPPRFVKVLFSSLNDLRDPVSASILTVAVSSEFSG